MRKWTKKHARFIGRIIFANFLEIPLERYKNIIDEVESSALFKKQEVITKRLSKAGAVIKNANISGEKVNIPSKVIAKLVKSKKGFSPKYTYQSFNKVYITCRNSHLIGNNLSFFYKLRRITSRNELTHKIIKGIIEHQKKFLITGDPLDLVSVTQIQLVKWLNRKHLSKIDTGWVSRLVNRLSVIIPSGDERLLKSFFPSQRNINKGPIKRLLDKENEDIESGKLKNPLTDNQIRASLKKKYGISLSRWAVGHCRKDLGIPPANRRLSGYKYPPFSANFSILYPLTSESVQNNAPACSGIYELRLKGTELEYSSGKTNIIYIGSAKNIRKRIKEHLRVNNKNGSLRDFLKKFDCSFRYIPSSAFSPRTTGSHECKSVKEWQNIPEGQLPRSHDCKVVVRGSRKCRAKVKAMGGNAGWREKERELFELFVATFSSAPKCNRVRP